MHTDSARGNRRLKTPAQARAELVRRGIAISDWASRHGFTRSLVYEVLSGRRPCRRGQSHRAAVLLGMKDGEIEEAGSESPAARTRT